MKSEEKATTQEKVDKFAYLSPMLNSALTEMREFSKKKQDGIVSATKIKILNRLLSDIRDVLADEESVNYLDVLNEEDLPQNSDAVLVLGQYRAALDSYKTAHYQYLSGYGNIWITKEFLQSRNGEYDDVEEDVD